MLVTEATVEGLAGAAGAMVATFATYPLITVSTLQAVRSDDVDECDTDSARPKWFATWKALAELVRCEGWHRLYNGIRPALVGAGLSQGLYFYFYSALRDLVLTSQPLPQGAVAGRKLLGQASSPTPALTVTSSMFVASIAGCCNVIITNPIWVLATRMQADTLGGDAQTSLVSAFKSACQDEGYQWAVKGLVPSLIMVCNPTIQYMIYERLLTELRRHKALSKKAGSATLTALEIFVASSIAKIGATLCTYPLLLVKSRLQVDTTEGLRISDTLDTIQKMFEEQGILGFYRGMGAKLLQSVLAAALMLVIKEKLSDAVRWLLTGKVKHSEQ